MLFKLSNLNSNLALTLGYLNPALNNSALVYSRNITNLPPLELLHTGNGLFPAFNLISGTTFLYLCTIVE